jgi:uncharacterized protein (UPF0276 family)
VRASLAALQTIVPDVGFENSVFYGHFGDPLDEPHFVARCLEAQRTHLLLDLHNVTRPPLNAGFEPWRYVERLPLERVIEIHVSGGNESDPRWLPSRRVLRLDSHDNAVPEEVWRLAERVVRCVRTCARSRSSAWRARWTMTTCRSLREELARARSIAEEAK